MQKTEFEVRPHKGEVLLGGGFSYEGKIQSSM